MKQQNMSNQNSPPSSSEFMLERLCDGKKREGAKPSKPHLGNKGIMLNPTPQSAKKSSSQSFTLGLVPETNDLTLIDKLPPSATYTPEQKSSAKLESDSTSKEKTYSLIGESHAWRYRKNYYRTQR